ncbi:unnamed protein product [Peniophora sp. CBMAI 1063]|nr:unnamed protein product [Peniophora sp. CBMAI 1063]
MSSLDLTTILPDETLAHVFYCATVADPIRKANRESRYCTDETTASSRLGWIQITFVCARWRRVAVEEAGLWSKPSFLLGPLWLDEFMRRSKGALLDVAYRYPDDRRAAKTSRLIGLVTTESTRVQRLRINMDSDKEGLLNPIFKSHLSALEELDVYMYSSGSRQLGGWEEALGDLSRNALRLRCLDFNLTQTPFATIDWRVSAFPSLRRLHLQHSGRLPDSSLPRFLEALRCMPLLAELLLYGHPEESRAARYSLYDCNEACMSPAGETTMVDLPSLRELQLEQSLDSYAHLLYHTHIPANAHVNIKDVHISSPHEVEVMCTHLASCMGLHSSQENAYRSATIKLTAGYVNDFIPGHIISTPGEIQVWLRRAVDTNPMDYLAWMMRKPPRPDEMRLTLQYNTFPALSPSLDLSNITTLTLNGHADVRDPWPVIMAFPNVETLYLISQSNAFQRPAGLEMLALSGDRLPFPKLRYLVLTRYFMPDIVCDLPQMHARKPRTVLEDIIYERRAWDVPLRTVEVPMWETIEKIEAGGWDRDPHIGDIRATISRLQEMPEVRVVGEHPHNYGWGAESI